MPDPFHNIYDPNCFLDPDLIEEALDGLPSSAYTLVVTSLQKHQSAYMQHAAALEYLVDSKGDFDRAISMASEIGANSPPGYPAAEILRLLQDLRDEHLRRS